VFSGFDVVNGQAVLANLPTLNEHVQTLGIFQAPPFDTISPIGTDPDDITALQPNLGGDGSNITPAEASRALLASFRIENPQVHDPKTVDCASCHLSSVTRITLNQFGFMTPTPNAAFSSPRWNLTATAARADNDFLQNFSYQPGGLLKPSIRQRVVNDAALSADYVNQNLP
jgi:hypothetical protein